MGNAVSNGRTDEIIRLLKDYVLMKPPNFGDGESILTLLYEAYNEVNNMDNTEVKQDFHDLYVQMNGMPLKEMDKIIYPVCTLCRSHEKSGFIEGIKVGIRLRTELEG